MLQTRLWVGSILAIIGFAVVILDGYFEPFYPGWLFLIILLGSVTSYELVNLLRLQHPVPHYLVLMGVLMVVLGNWLPHLWPVLFPYSEFSLKPWPTIAMAFAIFVLFAFLREMDTFRGPSKTYNSIMQMSLVVWSVAYLSVIPSFTIQLRWFSVDASISTMALIYALLIPKICDVGAYFAGKYLGHHRLSPSLSPKKTWEGAIGGLTTAVVITVLLDQFGPYPLLCHSWLAEIGFGITVGGAGILGDLAESLIKRSCHQKDASQVVPGFGGVLDIVDAIFFAAPISYLWLTAFQPFYEQLNQ